MSTSISRRRALMLAMAAAGVGASTGLWTAAARAQAKEVKVAVVVPLSGAWARNGELHVKGAQLAVDDINAAGGIKALGGAKMKLIVADSGDSTEKAKKAAQRLLAQETDLVGGTRPVGSSFSVAVGEGGFDKLGLKLVVDEIYTPPLSDATSLVQKVRNAKPDILLMLTTNVPDTKLVVEKLNEMGLGKGRLAVLGNGGHMGAPELSQVVGKDLLEGVMGVIANWGGKGQEKIISEFKTKAKEPWMPQDSISSYGDMWIFKDAMEKAGSADPKKVAAAIRSLDESDSAARYFPGGRLKFEPNGRRAGAELVIVQWQSGEPKAIYPPSLAAAKPMWPKR